MNASLDLAHCDVVAQVGRPVKHLVHAEDDVAAQCLLTRRLGPGRRRRAAQQDRDLDAESVVDLALKPADTRQEPCPDREGRTGFEGEVPVPLPAPLPVKAVGVQVSVLGLSLGRVVNDSLRGTP